MIVNTRLTCALAVTLFLLQTSLAHLQQYQPQRQFRPFFRQSQTPVEPAPQNLSPADQKKFNDYQRQIQQWQIAVVLPPGSGAQVGPQAPGSYPPPQGGYPPSQGGYPPSQGGYPPSQGGYPPSQEGYPPSQGGYPPASPPPSGGYPPSQAGPGPAPPGNVWIQVPAGSGTYYPSPPNEYPQPSPAPSPAVDAGSQYPPAPPQSTGSQNEVSQPPAVAAPPPPELLPAPVSEQPYPEPLPPPSNELPPPSNELPPPEAVAPPPASSGSGDSSALKAFCKAPRGQFPSASCDKFVNCWDDFVVEQDCPAGLYFNEGGFCDYPFNVDCSSRQPSAGQPGSGSVGGGAVAPPPSNGLEGPGFGGPVALPPPGSPGSEYPAPGSPGSEYPAPGSPGSGYPAPGSPGSEYPPAPPAQGAGSESSVCPGTYGTYRSKTNCGAFYVCVAGKPYEFVCPAGLNFHEDLKVCDYPYRVECNGVPTNPSPPEPSPEEQVEPSDGSPAPSPVAPAPAPAPEVPVQPVEPAPVSPAAVDPSLSGYFGQRKYYGQYPSYKSSGFSNLQCYGRSNIMYRLTPSCSTVAICQGGIARVMSCPQGMRFDSPTRRCLPAYRARC